MKCRIRRLTKTLTIILALAQPVLASRVGPGNGGGGSPATVNVGALRLLIHGDGLKNAMLNYVRSLPVGLVEDGQVRLSFQRMSRNDQLSKDIQNSKYIEATPGHPCVDAYNNTTAAATLVGVQGAPICFDIQKLVKAYKGRSDEDVMVQLAALAFHEHTHHFQIFATNNIQNNESEANSVGGYVLLTAHFVQLPLLKWTKPSTDGSNDLQTIQNLMSLLKAKEQLFLSPRESDYDLYPDYRGKSDRGIARLLPREKYDGNLPSHGGGAYYSFSTLTHEYGHGSDIGLEQNNLKVGFAGCDFGFFVGLGSTPIENVASNRPELEHMLNFQPAHDDEPNVRQQQATYLYSDSARPVVVNGFNYISRVLFDVGQTYALRSIIYGQSDLAVVFNILRQDPDGSLVIVWKKLKSYPVYECSRH